MAHQTQQAQPRYPWPTKAVHPKQTLVLGHRDLAILPTTFGFFWFTFVILLLLFGTNYQNNLILGLALFMFSLFISHFFLCFLNMNRLKVALATETLQVADQPQSIIIMLNKQCECEKNLKKNAKAKTRKKNGKNTWQLECSLIDAEQHYWLHLPRIGQQITQAVNSFGARSISIQAFPRLKLESQYPMGLSRCWCYLQLTEPLICYPEPTPPRQPDEYYLKETTTPNEDCAADQDFSQLQAYRQGESMQRIAWKQYAQGRGLFTKHFEGQTPQALQLQLPTQSRFPLAEQLAHLSHLIHDAYHKQHPIKLKLPLLAPRKESKIAQLKEPLTKESALIALTQYFVHCQSKEKPQ